MRSQTLLPILLSMSPLSSPSSFPPVQIGVLFPLIAQHPIFRQIDLSGFVTIDRILALLLMGEADYIFLLYGDETHYLTHAP